MFGGEQLTATDIIAYDGELKLGDPSKIAHIDQDVVDKAKVGIKRLLEVCLTGKFINKLTI